MAAQVLGCRPGYGTLHDRSRTRKPIRGVLLVFAQLMAGLLFFALGLDREILRDLRAEPGEDSAGRLMTSGPPRAEPMIGLRRCCFSVGLRLALAGGGAADAGGCRARAARAANAQLQLLSLAFPAKMLTALVVLAWWRPCFRAFCDEIGGADVSRALLGGSWGYDEPWRTNRGKTEKPTQRRLEKAREEGHFPAAKEFVSGAAVSGLRRAAGGPAAPAGSRSLRDTTRVAARMAFQRDLTPRDLERSPGDRRGGLFAAAGAGRGGRG